MTPRARSNGLSYVLCSSEFKLLSFVRDQINVAKLEDEQRDLLVEEEKKKQEMASVLRRKVAALSDNEGREDEFRDGGDDEEVKTKESWDKVTIPKLEAYTQYDNPRPLFLFMKVLCRQPLPVCSPPASTFIRAQDGEIQHEMRSSNPPKMLKLTQRCAQLRSFQTRAILNGCASCSIVTNTPLDEKELAALDYHAEFSKRKKQMEEDKKRDENKSVEDTDEPFDEAVPRVILSVSISDLPSPARAAGEVSGAVVAVYEKNPVTDEYKYVGRSERITYAPLRCSLSCCDWLSHCVPLCALTLSLCLDAAATTRTPCSSRRSGWRSPRRRRSTSCACSTLWTTRPRSSTARTWSASARSACRNWSTRSCARSSASMGPRGKSCPASCSGPPLRSPPSPALSPATPSPLAPGQSRVP